MLNKIKVQG